MHGTRLLDRDGMHGIDLSSSRDGNNGIYGIYLSSSQTIHVFQAGMGIMGFTEFISVPVKLAAFFFLRGWDLRN